MQQRRRRAGGGAEQVWKTHNCPCCNRASQISTVTVRYSCPCGTTPFRSIVGSPIFSPPATPSTRVSCFEWSNLWLHQATTTRKCGIDKGPATKIRQGSGGRRYLWCRHRQQPIGTNASATRRKTSAHQVLRHLPASLSNEGRERLWTLALIQVPGSHCYCLSAS